MNKETVEDKDNMKNKASSYIWGLLLIAAGVILAGNILNFWQFDFTFAGWWTLFIIVPCAISIITGGSNFGNVFGLLIGVALLVNAQGFFDFDLINSGLWTLFIIVPCVISIFKSGLNLGNVLGLFIGVALLLNSLDIIPMGISWRLVIPIILVGIGLTVIFGGSRRDERVTHINSEGVLRHTAIFTSYETVFADEHFHGADLFCLFGGVEMDLRGAVITEDVSLKSTTIFGGMDIHVPNDVNVQVSSTPIFGGVSNDISKRKKDPDLPTLFINCTCVFGGVELK